MHHNRRKARLNPNDEEELDWRVSALLSEAIGLIRGRAQEIADEFDLGSPDSIVDRVIIALHDDWSWQYSLRS